MDVEQIEYNDWNLKKDSFNTLCAQQLTELSVNAYYVDRWINKIKDHTFETQIYDADKLPDQLPYEKCMIRYEHCSPKDSEYWGACRLKEEALKMFNSSLRCYNNHGDKIIVRKWQENIKKEYRIFWNTRVVAGCLAINNDSLEDSLEDGSTSALLKDAEQILKYLSEIDIPYYRCVIDLALIEDESILENRFWKIIEFNSWETNSGALLFDWKKDTEKLYPECYGNSLSVEFRRKDLDGNIIVVNVPNNFVLKIKRFIPMITGSIFDPTNKNIKILETNKNSLLTDKYLIIQTDIWLIAFDKITFKDIIWVRNTNRFDSIIRINQNIFKSGTEYFDHNLSKLNEQQILNLKHEILNLKHEILNLKHEKINGDTMNNNQYMYKYRYGFMAEIDGEETFIRVANNGIMYLSE
jgi:hypothetical protein